MGKNMNLPAARGVHQSFIEEAAKRERITGGTCFSLTRCKQTAIHGMCNSYWNIMLQRILQAATAVAFPSTTADSNSSSSSSLVKSIWISLQGEMGGTIWTAPASYQKILQDMKSAWAEAQQSWQGSRTAADVTMLLGALFSAGNVAGTSDTSITKVEYPGTSHKAMK
jgi:hypothetical protein